MKKLMPQLIIFLAFFNLVKIKIFRYKSKFSIVKLDDKKADKWIRKDNLENHLIIMDVRLRKLLSPRFCIFNQPTGTKA